jgi:uncharacterized protein YkuJ
MPTTIDVIRRRLSATVAAAVPAREPDWRFHDVSDDAMPLSEDGANSAAERAFEVNFASHTFGEYWHPAEREAVASFVVSICYPSTSDLGDDEDLIASDLHDLLIALNDEASRGEDVIGQQTGEVETPTTTTNAQNRRVFRQLNIPVEVRFFEATSA